jgi:hypothetical protein
MPCICHTITPRSDVRWAFRVLRRRDADAEVRSTWACLGRWVWQGDLRGTAGSGGRDEMLGWCLCVGVAEGEWGLLELGWGLDLCQRVLGKLW